MKRSPLQRYTRLRRTAISRRTHHRSGAELTDWKVVRDLVIERSHGLCEGDTPGCQNGPHRGEHLHHVILRSHGGPDEAWNLLHLCAAAHRWVHDHPAESYELGLMRRGVA